MNVAWIFECVCVYSKAITIFCMNERKQGKREGRMSRETFSYERESNSKNPIRLSSECFHLLRRCSRRLSLPFEMIIFLRCQPFAIAYFHRNEINRNNFPTGQWPLKCIPLSIVSVHDISCFRFWFP